MDIKDFRSRILESSNKEFLEEQELIISLGDSKNLKFKGIIAIYQFYNKQYQGYKSFNSLPDELSQSKNYFERACKNLIAFIQTGGDSQTQWNNIKNYLQRPPSIALSQILLFDSSQAKFILQLFEESPKMSNAAFQYFTTENNLRTTNKEEFIGTIRAMEFDKAYRSSYKNKDLKSIEENRAAFETYLSEKEKEITQTLGEQKQHLELQTKEIVDRNNDRIEEFNEWYDKYHSSSIEFQNKSENDFKQFLKRYEENLELEAPARYWSQKAKSYKKDGDRFRTILIISMSIILLFLIGILLMSPDYIFNVVFERNSIALIRWSIVFIVLISFFAVYIKALLKAMFSAYHLSRDAEERRTLTLYYLSLLKSDRFEKEDRNMIVQSLFSRTDTGLLKDDSSPSMPNDILNKILGKS